MLVRDVFGMSALAGVPSIVKTAPVTSVPTGLLVRDVFGISAVAGVPSIVKTAAETSVPAAFACP